MYVIVKGKVKGFRTRIDGEEKTLNVLAPEDAILGEMSLLDGLPRSASATATEKTIAFSLSRKDFHIFLQDNLSAALKIIEILSLRLRAADERLANEI